MIYCALFLVLGLASKRALVFALVYVIGFEAVLSRTRGGHSMAVCFDTCHAHAAGYDLSTEDGYDRTFGAFDRVLGLDLLRAFHLNDSKTPSGSRVDRHAEIGDGYLGLLPFWRLVNDPRFAGRPAVLETPSGPDKLPSFKRNLQRLRALIGAPRPSGPPKSQALPEKRDPRQGRLFASDYGARAVCLANGGDGAESDL